VEGRNILFQYTKTLKDGKVTKSEMTVGSSLAWAVAAVVLALAGGIVKPGWMGLLSRFVR
jgi:hypothetical protein